ncbi:hypothetical protein C8J57DRAFT_1254599 [Mycena rebaudengoi]|nr:hypothetical protein C8J57DRAFT_1254599 [Mycena rebaudengoi]
MAKPSAKRSKELKHSAILGVRTPQIQGWQGCHFCTRYTRKKSLKPPEKEAVEKVQAEECAVRKAKVEQLERLRNSQATKRFDLVGEVVSHCDRETLLQLFYLSRVNKSAVRRYLYRHVVVHGLEFAPPIEYRGKLTRRWTQFLENQPNLAFLELYEPLLSHVPQLPALKNLIATAPLAAQILEVNVVPSIILYQCTNGIRHIDSVSLEKFARAKPGLVLSLLAAARHLTATNFPAIRTLRIVSHLHKPSSKRMTNALGSQSSMKSLRNVHYCTPRGCHNWARSEEELGSGIQYRLWPQASWVTEAPVQQVTIESAARRHRLRKAEHPIVEEETISVYNGTAPETEIETEWRLSMQAVADMAEEWVAAGEAKWQEDFQSIADWAMLEYGLFPMPLPGTQAHWECEKGRGIVAMIILDEFAIGTTDR